MPSSRNDTDSDIDNYTDIDILTFTINALECIDNVQDAPSKYRILLDDYYEPKTPYIEVSLYSEEERHGGYCSDNDGSVYIHKHNKKIYIKLPPELEDQLPTLKEKIYDGYFDDYKLPCHYQCYCGGNNNVNRIKSLDIIVS